MNYLNLSKEISYALRHAPWEYELELDEEGFVEISQLLFALNEKSSFGRAVTKNDLEEMIRTSEKKRHEISGEKIRALYGHSIPQFIKKEKGVPPKILYHGTAKKFLSSIKAEALKPMARQYVHLSVDIDTAKKVGKRRDDNPIILQIDTEKAIVLGATFYIGNDKVWLADKIPSECLLE